MCADVLCCTLAPCRYDTWPECDFTEEEQAEVALLSTREHCIALCSVVVSVCVLYSVSTAQQQQQQPVLQAQAFPASTACPASPFMQPSYTADMLQSFALLCFYPRMSARVPARCRPAARRAAAGCDGVAA